MLLLLSVVAPFEAEVFDEPEGFLAVVESVDTVAELVLTDELVVVDELPLKMEVFGAEEEFMVMTTQSILVPSSLCLMVRVCFPFARL
jgi:hypothetical protein